jgi:hypothetical protein
MSLPPGPTQLSAVQLWRWLWEPLSYLEECRARFGETFVLRIPGMPPLVILTNPEHIRDVFAAHGDDMHAGEVATALRPFLGERSVILLDGPEHMRMRKLLMPPFHGERMQAYGRDMIDATHREIDAWPLREEVTHAAPFGRQVIEPVEKHLVPVVGERAEPRAVGPVVEQRVAAVEVGHHQQPRPHPGLVAPPEGRLHLVAPPRRHVVNRYVDHPASLAR